MRGKLICGTYVKHEKESARLRIGGGSWTIPVDDLEALGERAKLIRYVTEAACYEIGYQEATARGFERVLGGERKLVVPVQYWKRQALETA